jgi:hypothetical protein
LPEPAPVVPQPIAPVAAPLCPTCGQPLPLKIEPVAASNNPDERPVDPVEEERTDLPVRSSMRIQFLLKHYEKTMAQTQARIINDSMRYRYSRDRAGQM